MVADEVDGGAVIEYPSEAALPRCSSGFRGLAIEVAVEVPRWAALVRVAERSASPVPLIE